MPDADPRPPGTYTLVFHLPDALTVTFGAAGPRQLGPGWAAYTGSAFGPGGLARVDRHRELAHGEREVRHWHVDHLLAHAEARLAEAWTTPAERRECTIHAQLPGREVDVGASDCTCAGHLRVAKGADALRDALAELHDRRLALDHRA